MTSLTKHIVVLVVLVATIFSCNQNPSLQTYFVDNQEKPNFLSLDVPVSMLNIDQTKLTEDQKEAYNSVQKLNMLAYRKDSVATADYKDELSKVKTILDDDKYEELMRGGNSTDGKFMVKYVGEDDDIDEFILFGSSNNMGFAVVRILGNNMEPQKLMTLSSVLDQSNIDDGQLKQIIDFFK
ncbi:DUF4252 domain-containing protein [Subsaxibacter sp. CAU 1640]|uniref:DUF4252 domain-containing protein n=1 Tax=Subsaxibacter sp. CAU 1640 TaxID=2933271 RepID=UPI002005432A|nr:DUF4252 domain-containing protein [Subsaxibacter sp. CAU 1640]MCK7589928.1 DUF4252 domain-containing protein [Subsaxibacter sp. CAU 1640]